MSDLLRSIYLRIGVHTAPPGTLCHFLNASARAAFNRLRSLARGERYELTDLPRRNRDFVLAFRVSGGIGDHLIAARYIRDLLAVIGVCAFDIYSSRPAAARWIFASLPGYRRVFNEHHLFGTRALSHYQASFWLMSFVELLTVNGERMRPVAGVDIRRLLLIRAAIAKFNTKIRLFIDMHPRLDGYLAEIALLHGWTRMTFLHGVSGIRYGGDRLAIATDRTALHRFGLAGRPYITLHNGYDPEEGQRVGRGVATTKNYPHFAELITLLRRQFPALTIVQLGTVTSTPIRGVHCNLIGQTSIEQTAEIIRCSLLHVDGESGMVHLAACLGVTSCVIFGPTSRDYFAYGSNINIAPATCGNCWWMTPEWLKQCPRGLGKPRCVSDTSPQSIVTAIHRHLQLAIGDHAAMPDTAGSGHDSLEAPATQSVK